MVLRRKRKIVKFIIYIKRHRKLYASLIDKFIIALIFINSITLGIETSELLYAKYKTYLIWIDRIILWIFVLELSIKLLIMRSRFFKNGWNIFDMIVISISCIHVDSNIAILRSLRILRLFLLISFMPKLRFIVESLLNALQGIISITILLVLIFYVFGVMATHLFRNIAPENFGYLGISLASLFQVMTLDGWTSIIRPLIQIDPRSYLFFVPFILLTSYVILNIFIAIIINGMREARIKNEMRLRGKQIAHHLGNEDKKIMERFDIVLDRLSQLEEQISRLESNSSNKEEASAAGEK